MNVSSNRKEGIFNARGLISNTLPLKKVLYTHVQSRAGQGSSQVVITLTKMHLYTQSICMHGDSTNDV